jgi:hypothetical protein
MGSGTATAVCPAGGRGRRPKADFQLFQAIFTMDYHYLGCALILQTASPF